MQLDFKAREARLKKENDERLRKAREAAERERKWQAQAEAARLAQEELNEQRRLAALQSAKEVR